MPISRLLLTGAAALALAGCSLAPAYAPPATPVAVAFKEQGPWTPAQPADAQPRGQWWAMFSDPVLDGLETRVETANPNLAPPGWYMLFVQNANGPSSAQWVHVGGN